jgi:glycosyltransferase involved in cell wall biosynthesis
MTDASVVICTYTLDRWNELRAAVHSVLVQSRPAREVFVVVDGNEALRQRAIREIGCVTVVPNAKEPGLSGGRMTGAELASAPVVAFLDDDAIADENWLEELLDAYQDSRVLGAGGRIEPLWTTTPPAWFPAEFAWVVGCTYEGMQVLDGRVRNLIGANMSVRAEVLRHAGGFASKLGRRAAADSAIGVAGSCEETEFCIRAARQYPGGIWAYRPKARVGHIVSAQRITWRYFVHRCWIEGTAKAVLAGLTGAKDGLDSERRYVLSVLPRAVLREIGAAVGGQRGAAGRAGAICAGLAVTTSAYLRTRLALARVREDIASTATQRGAVSEQVAVHWGPRDPD